MEGTARRAVSISIPKNDRDRQSAPGEAVNPPGENPKPRARRAYNPIWYATGTGINRHLSRCKIGAERTVPKWDSLRRAFPRIDDWHSGRSKRGGVSRSDVKALRCRDGGDVAVGYRKSLTGNSGFGGKAGIVPGSRGIEWENALVEHGAYAGKAFGQGILAAAGSHRFDAEQHFSERHAGEVQTSRRPDRPAKPALWGEVPFSSPPKQHWCRGGSFEFQGLSQAVAASIDSDVTSSR